MMYLYNWTNEQFLFVQIGAMIKYLEDKYGERASCGDKGNLQIMRQEAQRLEQLVEEMKEKEKANAQDEQSEKGSEMESDEDVSTIYANTIHLFLFSITG